MIFIAGRTIPTSLLKTKNHVFNFGPVKKDEAEFLPGSDGFGPIRGR